MFRAFAVVRCVLFASVILEIYLELSWSPPVTIWTDWTYFAKAHRICKGHNLHCIIRTKTKSWSPKNCLWISVIKLWWGNNCGKAIKQFLRLRVSQDHSDHGNFEMEEDWHHPEPSSAIWQNQASSKLLCRVWRTFWVDSQVSLQQSINQAFMAEWEDDKKRLSGESHMTTTCGKMFSGPMRQNCNSLGRTASAIPDEEESVH